MKEYKVVPKSVFDLIRTRLYIAQQLGRPINMQTITEILAEVEQS